MSYLPIFDRGRAGQAYGGIIVGKKDKDYWEAVIGKLDVDSKACYISRVGRYEKLLEDILRGTSDANILFAQMGHLLKRLGFEERIRGAHHIFSKEGIEEILNIQPRGSKAKPYQVKQVRYIIVKYKLGES